MDIPVEHRIDPHAPFPRYFTLSWTEAEALAYGRVAQRHQIAGGREAGMDPLLLAVALFGIGAALLALHVAGTLPRLGLVGLLTYAAFFLGLHVRQLDMLRRWRRDMRDKLSASGATYRTREVKVEERGMETDMGGIRTYYPWTSFTDATLEEGIICLWFDPSYAFAMPAPCLGGLAEAEGFVAFVRARLGRG